MFDYADIIKPMTISPELDVAGEMSKAYTGKGSLGCRGYYDGIYVNFILAIENGIKPENGVI